MFSVDKFSDYLASSIKRNNPDSSSIVVLRYALNALINLIIIMFVVLVIASLTGAFFKASVAVIAFPLVRYFSGGLHLKSSTICNVISASLVLLSIYTPLEYWYNGFILNLLAIMLLLLFAPSGIKRSKLPKSSYPILKGVSVAIVSTNLLFHSPVLSIVFLLQALTTVPVFARLMERLNW